MSRSKEQISNMTIKFLEEEIICKFEVSKYVLVDNGG
jgi:hypothetical protein